MLETSVLTSFLDPIGSMNHMIHAGFHSVSCIVSCIHDSSSGMMSFGDSGTTQPHAKLNADNSMLRQLLSCVPLLMRKTELTADDRQIRHRCRLPLAA